MDRLTLKSPAKLNLYLAVLGKRADGYHEIETVFERIDLCDEITLRRRRSGISLVCPDTLPQGPGNLAYRAAELLKRYARTNQGVEIKLNKKIPIGAGLGGGSSNAASVLLGLKKLWRLRVNIGELFSLGRSLGADVPFFLLERSLAIGSGRGDEVTYLRSPKRLWHVLVNPGFRVSTKEIYEGIDADDEILRCAQDQAQTDDLCRPETSGLHKPCLSLTRRCGNARIIARAVRSGDTGSLNELLRNSLERPATEKFKTVLEIKEALKSLGVNLALMSGSGPTVFTVHSSKDEALKLASDVSGLNRWQVLVARTL